jgi:peptide/nickel transport system permease protein
MLTFLWRRLLVSIPVLFGVVLIVFLMLRLMPGDPAQILLFGTASTPEQVAALREQLGLNQPLPVQFGNYLLQLLQGNLGISYVTKEPVLAELAKRIPYTANLTLYAIGVGLLVGIPTGLIGGLRPGSIADKFATAFSVLGLAIPYFWLAQLLVLVFAVRLDVLPALGTGGPEALILPSLSLGLGLAAIITRILRSSLIEVYQQPYILVARAKGLSSSAVLINHALKNSLTSVVTMIGLQIGTLISGAVATEVIFGRPGIGAYLVSQILRKDIPTVQGIVLIIAVAYVVIGIIVDLLHGLLDPRVRKAWNS